MWIWLFENAAGLSRDELLAEEQPISNGSVSLFQSAFDPPLLPGETLTLMGGGPLRDDQGELFGPGQYTLFVTDGPHAFLWGDVTVDYSNAVADITIVPEPGTLCLLSVAAAVGLLRKGKRRIR